MLITQISYDGIELRSSDYRFTLQNAWNFEKSIVTNDIMGDGLNFVRSKIEPKSIMLNGFVMSNDISKVLMLNTIFSKNELKKIVITVSGLGRLYGYAEVTSRGKGSISRSVSVTLTMPDPYWYSAYTDQISLGGTTNAPLILPAVLPWTLGGITGASGSILNEGNADSYPVITIVGTCSSISISNSTTGESISINGSLTDSDTLVIDCRPSTCGVWLNGVPRIDLKTSPGWIHCAPGWNTFIFNRISLQTKKHCTVALQSRWI